MTYQFCLKGSLDGSWSSWFQDLTMTCNPWGDTLLTGELADQAALHGIIKRIRDTGLSLIYVKDMGYPQREIQGFSQN